MRFNLNIDLKYAGKDGFSNLDATVDYIAQAVSTLTLDSHQRRLWDRLHRKLDETALDRLRELEIGDEEYAFIKTALANSNVKILKDEVDNLSKP